MPEDNPQQPQKPITLPELPAVASLLLPVIGIPLALHALTGAAVGLLTFGVGAIVVGLTKKKLTNSPGQSPSRRTEDPETTV